MIYTGNYDNCRKGNIISISGDRGKLVGYTGKCLPELAPRLGFWKQWHEQMNSMPVHENTRFYIEHYYDEVLSKVDILDLLKDESDPILLCYEKPLDFCHRHIVANYIEFIYGIVVPEISVVEKEYYHIHSRPEYVRNMLGDLLINRGILEKQNGDYKLIKK